MLKYTLITIALFFGLLRILTLEGIHPIVKSIVAVAAIILWVWLTRKEQKRYKSYMRRQNGPQNR